MRQRLLFAYSIESSEDAIWFESLGHESILRRSHSDSYNVVSLIEFALAFLPSLRHSVECIFSSSRPPN